LLSRYINDHAEVMKQMLEDEHSSTS